MMEILFRYCVYQYCSSMFNVQRYTSSRINMLKLLFLTYNICFQSKKHTNGGTIDKSVGTLLYHIATKLKNQITHRRNLLIKYVASKKLASENQLNGKDNILSVFLGGEG